MWRAERIWKWWREPRTEPAPDAFTIPALTEDVTAALSRCRQGDVFADLTRLPIADGGEVRRVQAPLGAVLISQTCDVVLPNRLTVQLSPRVVLSGTPAREARDHKRPRYVALPALGDDVFADLEVVSTVTKATLAPLRGIHSLRDDDEERRFSRAVSRRYSRFAFPDEVVQWLRPLEDVIGSRARKAASPEGRLLDHVVELRVEATGGWREPPYDLVLIVVVRPGSLPSFPGDEPPEPPPDLRSWLRGPDGSLQKSPADIATRWDRSAEPVERYYLWAAIGEAWSDRCRPGKGADPAVLDAVRGPVASEVLSSDDFSLTRYRRSEQLDLDHLSSPTPQ